MEKLRSRMTRHMHGSGPGPQLHYLHLGLGDSEKLSDSPESTQHIPASLPPSLVAHQRAGRGHHWPVLACPGESTLCPCGHLPACQAVRPASFSAFLAPVHAGAFLTRAGSREAPQVLGGHTLSWHPLWNFLGCLAWGFYLQGSCGPDPPAGPDAGRGARTVP